MKSNLLGSSNRLVLAAGLSFVMTVGIILPSTLSSAQATISHRPVSDFVDAQGTYCFPPEFFEVDGTIALPPGAAIIDGCVIFIPTIPNYVGSGNEDFDRCASVDYAGIANEWIEDESGDSISFGTTTEGTVTERLLADGSVEVTVMLYTHNALTWVQECDSFATAPLLFGYRAANVLHDGAEPALGESFMKLVFINPEPGAPLPDLIQLLVERFGDIKYSSFHARADGVLHEQVLCYSANNCDDVPEGTLGKATIAQTGIYGHQFNPNSNVADGDPAFPAERIELRVIG